MSLSDPDIAVVPPILVGIVKGQITPLQLQSLRQVWCAGSPLSQALNESMCRLLNGAAMISQIWGMTEFGRISSSGCEKDTTGSVGRLLPNTQVRWVHISLLLFIFVINSIAEL